MSSGKNSSNGFSINPVRNSYFDSKELSLLNNVDISPSYTRFADVLPEDTRSFKPFIVDDWDVNEDLQNDKMLLDLSDEIITETDFIPKNHHRNFSSGKKTSMKNNELSKTFTSGSKDPTTTDHRKLFTADENELVNVFTHLKIDSNSSSNATSAAVSKGNLSNRHSYKDLPILKSFTQVPEKLHCNKSCSKTCQRLSVHSKERTLLGLRKDIFRRSLASSNRFTFPKEGLEDDSICKIKGGLFSKENLSSYGYAVKPDDRLRQIRKRGPRRFPVDRSSLLRSVLTKDVLKIKDF